MLSINTNLSSLITQRSIKDSTEILNTAIERMTTGYKINHAKDNAANYSIATNMTTKINGLMVAEDNTLQGLDLLSTANGTLDLISDKLIRLRALAEQSANGTYGEQSKQAINSEANALVDEIERLYSTSEYNGVKMYEDTPSTMPKVGGDGFIKAVNKRSTTGIKSLSEVDGSADLIDGTYSINNAGELAKLAQMTNSGLISEGDEFILAGNIDLKDYDNWVPIGTKDNKFAGKFDGNGYIISNLKIDNVGEDFKGLFGDVDPTGVLKNTGVVNVKITANNAVGALAGSTRSGAIIENCFSGGEIFANGYVGGLVGQCISSVTDSYSVSEVIATGNQVGGLVGRSAGAISNCHATGNVEGSQGVGGLAGYGLSIIQDSYATGNVTAEKFVGGLVGYGKDTIKNSYATGDISGTSQQIAGLIGRLETKGDIIGCFATGNVSGFSHVGGLVGADTATDSTIMNSFSTGNITAIQDYVGGFIGVLSGVNINVKNCYSEGYVEATTVDDWAAVAGFIGGLSKSASQTNSLSVENCYSTGNVVGNFVNVGGFIGYLDNTTVTNINNCYMTGTVFQKGNGNTGGVIGYLATHGTCAMSNVYMLGNLNNMGAIFVTRYTTSYGSFSMDNCYYNPEGAIGIEKYVNYKQEPDLGNEQLLDKVKTCGLDLPFIFNAKDKKIMIQVGTNSDEYSEIGVNISFSLDYIGNLRSIGLNQVDLLSKIDKMLTTVSDKQTEYGAAQNRLESALEEISTQYENLVSSRSTIRDADIAEESSAYIRGQILQQAAATLMSTANQNPMIALQLL